MLFRSYKPGERLSEFVENYWVYRGFESPRLKERIFPSGTFELVFNLRDNEMRIYKGARDECERYSGGILSGPHAEPFVTDTSLEACVMGVHFKPGGAFPFLGPSADDFRDNHAGVDAVWGRAASEIRERLCETPSLTRRYRLLEKFLLSRLFHAAQHHGAVTMALASLDRAQSQMTRELARDANLSEKRFIDVFRCEVGLNPRLFTRIRRFQRVLARAHAPGALDWAQIALSHGYFDQSHLIRDFVEFSGFGPSEYVHQLDDLRSCGVHCKFNHLPLIQ